MSIRDEVRASAAAHRDLGPGYDTAVAEGLVERIGEEIGVGRVVLALGSMGCAVGGTVAVLHPGDGPPWTVNFGQVVLIALIWIIVGVVNVANAVRN